jgi:hypothetical protein
MRDRRQIAIAAPAAIMFGMMIFRDYGSPAAR